MDLIQAQISEIKNLNAIYIFTTDSILKNNTEKYVGAKVVYDKDKTFSLDYKSEYFSDFIKRILTRYNKEKNKRNIVLLGDLTKKLVNDSLFDIEEEKQVFVQPTSILVNSKKNEVKRQEKYLKKVLKVIFKAIKNYDFVSIDSIDGFNHKYVVNYSIGNIKKQLHMLIFVKDEDNIDFRITNIDGDVVNINGTIEENLSIIKINWCDDVKNINGSIVYDSKEKIIEEKLYKDMQPIVSREYFDTLLDEDENIISFYLDLCNLKILNNIMKIDDNCYFLSDENVLGEDDTSIFYKGLSCSINIYNDQVIIRYKEKNGISKYNEQIKVVLDEEINEFILKKLFVGNKFYILLEKRNTKDKNNNYNYNILELDNDIDLFNPFDVKKKTEINQELKSFNLAKQYIKNKEGGK